VRLSGECNVPVALASVVIVVVVVVVVVTACYQRMLLLAQAQSVFYRSAIA
jgi:hypothetical protein